MSKKTETTQKAKQDAPATKQAETETTAVTVPTAMFADDAGAGFENATQESFAIPFLGVLQALSPQVNESEAEFIEGAKAGMLYENVNSQLFSGKDGVQFVQAHYRRVFIRWGARDNNGGFKGEYTPEQIADMRAKGEIKELDGQLFVPLEDGTVNPKKCDRFTDTRNHYVLLIDPKTGAHRQAVISLSSTQIKKSKLLMALFSNVRVKHGPNMIQPATYANIVKATTVAERNDKGSWFGWKFELDGLVESQMLYSAAKAFHQIVKAGQVETKYQDAPDSQSDEKF
jgi:hypothetical protein